MEIKVRKSLRVMGCALVATALAFALAPAQNAHAASKPAKVTKVKVSKVKTTSAKVTWKKASSKSVKGYQVRIYKGMKTFKTYTVKGRKATSKTVTKLKTNTKYSAKVRAYKGSKHKKYGKWSSAKKFTTKKVAKKPTANKPSNTKPSNNNSNSNSNNNSNSNSNSNSNANSGKNDSSTHLHVWQRSKTHNEPWYTEYLAKHSWVEYVPVKVKRYEITETQYDCALCRDFPEYADPDVGWQNVGAGHFWKEHQSTLKEAITSGEAINVREVVLQEAGEELVTDNPQTVIKCECGKELVVYSHCLSCGEYLSTAYDSGEHSYEEHHKFHPSVTSARSSVEYIR